MVIRSSTVIAIVGLLATAALVGGTAPTNATMRDRQARSAIVVPGPRFVRLPRGWKQFAEAPFLLTRQGANADVYALSWPFQPNSLGWANSIPRNGIAVEVLLIRREVGGASGLNLCRFTPHLDMYPLVRLPLRLPSTTTGTLEGAAKVPEYRIFGRIGESYNFEIRIDINNPRPGGALLHTAQRVISAISFPRWPNKASC